MKILILCTGNSCRSQMAHGYFSHFLSDDFEVYSAGTKTHGVNPRAITVMAEEGIDISHHTSNLLDEYLPIEFDYILTVCDNAKEACPIFPGKGKLIHHSFSDPYGATGTEEEILSEFRIVRDEIKSYIQEFISKENLSLSSL